MKIKKILTSVLAAVLAASAAACGDGGNTTTEDRNHIEMYVMDAGYRTEVFDELAKAFQVHFPDVTIKIYPSTGVDSKRANSAKRTAWAIFGSRANRISFVSSKKIRFAPLWI